MTTHVLRPKAEHEMDDSDFALVYTTADGRKVRKLPIHDAAHVRNALARFNQTDMPADKKAAVLAKIRKRAHELGVGDYTASGEEKK
jgi:hypothetical protein